MEGALCFITGVSAGVTILFSPGLDMDIISTTEIVYGRAAIGKATLQNISFVFIFVYAPNQGLHRTDIFNRLGEYVVMEGD